MYFRFESDIRYYSQNVYFPRETRKRIANYLVEQSSAFPKQIDGRYLRSDDLTEKKIGKQNIAVRSVRSQYVWSTRILCAKVGRFVGIILVLY